MQGETNLELLDYGVYALVRRGFECEHGIIAVKAGELGTIAIEGLVVELDELLCMVVSLC